ncbi:MAG: TenA family transcriptional regulator [Actinomycetota bacterium]|jgi:thiaminase/transcriptional activator TenA|nr:TenA family transcriptional regulator [Rubrobacter sp.]MDQ3507792.1 TenA family transcriptional regulator [Actinomycetota bacterium]
MKTNDLIEAHDPLWRDATEHPFLEGAREGTLPDGAFDEWLVQDYLFVLSGLVFQSRLVPRSPRRDQSLLIGGLAALENELGWFETKAKERNLPLENAERHPTNRTYGNLFENLEERSYAANITALWAVEQAYLDAWTHASPGAAEYKEFVGHWTTPEFAEYVGALKNAADAALEAASEDEKREAEASFLEVARLERDFWGIAVPGGEQ